MQIYVKPDFMTAKECQSIIERFKRYQDNPAHHGIRRMQQRIEIDGRFLELEGVINLAAGQIIAQYHPDDLVLDHVLVSEMRVGDAHALHCDNVKLDGTPNHTPHRRFTAMIYLNTCQLDYDGGQIMFPTECCGFSPTPGFMVGMPAHIQHEVKPILSGTRYALVIWWR